jgi:hypothetical protein
LRRHCTTADISLCGQRSTRRYLRRRGTSRGGHFDSYTDKLDDAEYDAVLKAARQVLSAKFKVDAVLYPGIQVVDAPWHDQWAGWVGVMTGSPCIDADVDFYELPGETFLIRRQYKASCSPGRDICTPIPPMAEKQIKFISDAIVAEWVRH